MAVIALLLLETPTRGTEVKIADTREHGAVAFLQPVSLWALGCGAWERVQKCTLASVRTATGLLKVRVAHLVGQLSTTIVHSRMYKRAVCVLATSAFAQIVGTHSAMNETALVSVSAATACVEKLAHHFVLFGFGGTTTTTTTNRLGLLFDFSEHGILFNARHHLALVGWLID